MAVTPEEWVSSQWVLSSLLRRHLPWQQLLNPAGWQAPLCGVTGLTKEGNPCGPKCLLALKLTPENCDLSPRLSPEKKPS